MNRYMALLILLMSIPLSAQQPAPAPPRAPQAPRAPAAPVVPAVPGVPGAPAVPPTPPVNLEQGGQPVKFGDVRR